MAEKEVIREKVTTGAETQGSQVEKPVKTEESHTLSHVVYFLFGTLDVFLIFRLFFRATGANPGSGFVDFIYSLTAPFVIPFQAIFSRATTEGAETTAVFEPETLIAILVYGLVGYGIARLVQIASGRAHEAE